MMSRISSCNATILKKNLTRFWPIMVLCAFVGFLLLPVGIADNDFFSVVWQLNEVIGGILPVAIVGYALTCACLVFGYLHKGRSSNMLHALPVTRSSLFVSNFLSGLLLFLLPWVAICLASVFAFVANGIRIDILLSAFAVGVMEYLFFFSLAVFCMILCGKTVYGFLVYMFLNVGLYLMEMMVLVFVEPFLYGIDMGYNLLCDKLPMFYLLGEKVWWMEGTVTNSGYLRTAILTCDWLYLGILTAVALVLIGLAWLLYRKRHMEQVGNPIAYPRLQGVVHVVVSLFAALALGLFICVMLFANTTEGSIGTAFLLSLLIGGFIGYFGVEMLLRKTPKVFQKKTFLGYGIFAVALTLMMLCVRFDWLNIVGYVPESNCVTVQYNFYDYGFTSASVTVTDPASIETIRDLHQAIIENREALERAENRYQENRYSIALSYQLDSDSTVTREYRISDDPEVWEIYKAFEAFLKDQRTTTSYVQALELCDNCSIFVIPTDITPNYTLNRTHLEAIQEALLQDVQEGTLDLLTLRCVPDYFYGEVGADWEEPQKFLKTHSGFLIESIPRVGYQEEPCMYPLFIPETATHTYALLSELIH